MIVVAGPPAAGKTTVAERVTATLGVPVDSFDTAREHRYGRWGYTHARAEWHYRQGGAAALHRYESRFELNALERAVTGQADRVIDLGGGVLLQQSEKDEQRLADALAKADVMVLALPSGGLPTLARRIARRPEGKDWLAAGGEELVRAILTAAESWADRGAVVVDTSSEAAVRAQLAVIAAKIETNGSV